MPYETQRLNLANGDQRQPEYLKLNPRGRVPTLVVDGEVLTENVGIVTYVAGGLAAAKLWPKDTWHQAKAVSTMAWLSNTVHPSYGHYLRPARYADDEPSQESIKAKGKTMYEGYLREIDGLLEGRKWSIGDHFTAVDGYLVVFYRWGNRAGLPMRSMKNYAALVERVLERPAVAKVMADEGIQIDK